ncbi:hypothetical protein TELCIR_09026 [Teladorsagia circumcincta]|uniref:Uncharacterized protein n=1 Tax=Teladorsagia circumcincta TaxID=45464 RepID=A0A2G9UFX5_TELCI|nr:hypothetical protein TELCIR_09026 [Teladorsagia circumcincta]
MARHQVRSGVETLTAAASDENATTVHFMAENYLKNLPSECTFLKDVDEFEKLLEPEVSSSTQAGTTESSATSPSEMTTAEVELKKSEEMATVEFVMETTPIVVEEQPAESMNPTSTRADGETTVVPVPEGGFIAEGESGHVTIMLPDEEAEVKTMVVMTTPSAEATVAEDKEASHEESKGDIGMDVNEITSPAPTEPVIVVDDTPSDIDENRVQAGTKQEVKSNSAASLALSSVFVAVTALVLL